MQWSPYTDNGVCSKSFGRFETLRIEDFFAVQNGQMNRFIELLMEDPQTRNSYLADLEVCLSLLPQFEELQSQRVFIAIRVFL